MTNISNYGPVRRLSPPVSADNRKPYSRTGLKGVLGTLDLNSGDAVVPPTLDSPYYPFHIETPQLEAPTQSAASLFPMARVITGFPTYEQYQRIEEEYLSSLSERKQPKALISQSLFDKIYAVLQNGSEDRASTAQFRFWVRKMFVLAYPQTFFNHNTTTSSQPSEPVVLHDKRPVAIKERLYEVLCYCHAMARHGGRDKTCATLRLHYSWVPKELTAKFVKACPTCTLKRSGNPDLLSQFSYATPSYLPTAAAAAAAPEPAHPPLTGGPNDSSPTGLSYTGSSSSDNNNNTSAASAAASFTSSIFATPDLSVYPSPTLSTGSGGGPMTPSPYLHGGLFGYPAVFDPGHSSLSSVAGWDPSPSPCVQVYSGGSGNDEPQPSSASDETIDSRAQHSSLRLHLPVPKDIARFVRSSSSSSSSYNNNDDDDHSGGGRNIDPALFIEGLSAPTGTTVFNVQNFHMLLQLPEQLRQTAPPTGGMMYAPVPMGVGRIQSVLCGMQEMDAEVETEVEVEVEVEVEATEVTERGRERWESPEAWLVPSDSAEEADGCHD
jgi:hypothetical protein